MDTGGGPRVGLGAAIDGGAPGVKGLMGGGLMPGGAGLGDGPRGPASGPRGRPGVPEVARGGGGAPGC